MVPVLPPPVAVSELAHAAASINAPAESARSLIIVFFGVLFISRSFLFVEPDSCLPSRPALLPLRGSDLRATLGLTKSVPNYPCDIETLTPVCHTVVLGGSVGTSSAPPMRRLCLGPHDLWAASLSSSAPYTAGTA